MSFLYFWEINLIYVEIGHVRSFDVDKRYHQTSNIRRTLVGNKLVDYSDAVGASSVGAATNISLF